MDRTSAPETLERSAATARSSHAAHAMARGLGWFSIGLGLAELLAPRAMARVLGMPGRENLLRAYGLREVAVGIGILASDRPAPWLWARAGGDVVDLATLGQGVDPANRTPVRTDAALAAVAGVGIVDLACARALVREQKRTQAFVDEYRQRSGLPWPPDEMRGAAR